MNCPSKLQDALINGVETLESLTSKYSIHAKRHPKYNNLVMLKYDQISSPFEEPLVQEARGIILDENNKWKPVSWPFSKFFNAEESLAAKIDWRTAKIQEKLDGSLCHMYFYDNQWHVASSGLPDAGGNVNGLNMTFAELFWKTWNDNHYELPHSTDGYLTFIFELMTPFNRVVVNHKENKITLIGVRSNISGQEKNLDFYYGFDWPIVRGFLFKDLEGVKESFSNFEGIDQEGYVVVDDNFNRVKVKHPGYVALHHMRGNDGPTYKKMLNIILKNETSELLTYFPEWKPIYDEVYGAYQGTMNRLAWEYISCMELTDKDLLKESDINPVLVKKIFAKYAIVTTCPDAMFKKKSGKIVQFEEYLRSVPLDRALEIIGIKNGI